MIVKDKCRIGVGDPWTDAALQRIEGMSKEDAIRSLESGKLARRNGILPVEIWLALLQKAGL